MAGKKKTVSTQRTATTARSHAMRPELINLPHHTVGSDGLAHRLFSILAAALIIYRMHCIPAWMRAVARTPGSVAEAEIHVVRWGLGQQRIISTRVFNLNHLPEFGVMFH